MIRSPFPWWTSRFAWRGWLHRTLFRSASDGEYIGKKYLNPVLPYSTKKKGELSNRWTAWQCWASTKFFLRSRHVDLKKGRLGIAADHGNISRYYFCRLWLHILYVWIWILMYGIFLVREDVRARKRGIFRFIAKTPRKRGSFPIWTSANSKAGLCIRDIPLRRDLTS